MDLRAFSQLVWACLAVSMSVLCACGGSAAVGMHPSSPFTEQDAALFDDSVDFVADPDALSGRWADDWQRDLRARTAGSDVVVAVTIPTMQTQIDPQQHTSYRMTPTVVDRLKNDAPEELSLSVAQDEPGYMSIESARTRLVSERFVLFAKYYAKPDGSVAAHFHLSIASPQVVARIRAELGLDKPVNTKIVKTKIVKDE